MANTAIAKEVDLSRAMVMQWRQRFIGERVVGLEDRSRPGKPRQYSNADRLRVIETACTQKLVNAQPHVPFQISLGGGRISYLIIPSQIRSGVGWDSLTRVKL